jgi:hypothetical protein
MSYIDSELDPLFPVFAPGTSLINCYMLEHQAKKSKLQPIFSEFGLFGFVGHAIGSKTEKANPLGTDKCGKTYAAVMDTIAAKQPSNYDLVEQISVIRDLLANLTARMVKLEQQNEADKKTIKQLQKKLKPPKELMAVDVRIPRVTRRKIKSNDKRTG